MMEQRTESSRLMAQRLKQLREERGLSHERLSKALLEEYGIKISADSLINYEVAVQHHSKFGKNQGMRVEFLQAFSEFYDVSTDYLVGISNIRSRDLSIRQICEYTGLSEDTILTLAAWSNAPFLAEKAKNEELTPKEALVIKQLSRLQQFDPHFCENNFFDIIQKLVACVSGRADDLLGRYNAIILSEMLLRRNGRFLDSWSKFITDETYDALSDNGYRIVRADVAKELDWEYFLKVIRYEIDSRIKDDLDNKPKLWAKTDDEGRLMIPLI